MFKNSNVNFERQDNQFERVERRQPERSVFDLSHDVKTTFQMGQLIPCMLLETIPGDTFKIKSEVLMRFAPMLAPLMHRVDVKLHYFYVPNRILAKNDNLWERFLVGEDIEWPHYVFDAAGTNTGADNRILEYLGIPITPLSTVTNPKITLNAFPIHMYYAIYDEFYRDPRKQDPHLPTGGLVAGNNDGVNLTQATDDFNVKRINWNYDYFTAATPLPQSGEGVQIPMFDPGLKHSDYDEYILGPYRITDAVRGNPGVGTLEHTNHGTFGTIKTTGVDEAKYIDTQYTAAPIAQLRQAIALQSYLERLNRSTARYRDFMVGFWGNDPQEGVIDDPQYIGGGGGKVQVSEVLQTADTSNAVLGAYAGQAMSMVDGNNVEWTCQEHGHIMAIVSVAPKTSYFQGLHRLWSRTEPLDYALPEFAHIGDQAIRKEEIYYLWPQASQEENKETWGYIPRYSEYRFQNDIMSGQMRYTFLNWNLARYFVGNHAPALGSQFMECNPDTGRVFVTGQAEDEIYCHIYHKVTAIRPLPKWGIPRL